MSLSLLVKFKHRSLYQIPALFATEPKIGYARVSTDTQETHLQMDALKRAKCNRIYQEKVSGARAERPESSAPG